jgi:myosin heavy subunit
MVAGVDKDVLELSLTTKYISIETNSAGRRHSNIRTPRNSIQAAYSRDAMAKSIYQVDNPPTCLSIYLSSPLS